MKNQIISLKQTQNNNNSQSKQFIIRQRQNPNLHNKNLMSNLHEIHLLQQKLTHLEADNMIYQDQIQRLRKRIFSLEEYRIKYELLLEQHKEESPLGRSRRVDEINNMNKRIEESNEKWGMKMKVMEEKCQEVMRDLEEKTQMLEEKNERLEERNERLQIEVERLQRGGTSRDKYANAIESSQLSLLKEQVTILKSRNATLSQQVSVTKQKNSELLHKVESLNHKQCSVSELQLQLQEKVQQARYEEKEFYREAIVELEQRVEKLSEEVEYHKVRSSPDREQEVVRLNSEIKRIQAEHNTQINKINQLLHHQTQQMQLLSSTLSTSKSSSLSHTTDLQQQLQQLTAKLLTIQQCHHQQLIACRWQMQQVRQQQVDLLKVSFQKIQNNHDSERQQWQLILKEQQHQLQRIRLMWDGEKQKFADQKNKLKAKINQLKAREKLSPRQEKSRNQNQTYKLISSLRQIDQEENAYNDHESNVTFLSRQLKRATNKIQEKQRQCAKLLNQLKVQREQFQTQTEFIKKVERQQTHFYKQKLIEADLQNTKLLEQLRQKDKHIRDTTASTRLQHQTLRKQNHQLNDIIREMERDYNRLTDNKKNLFQQYRSQRDMVFTGKVELNQQRKDKWLHLDRQKNQLEIAYKERERQIRVQYQLRINQLAQKLASTNQLKQLASAENHILKERVQEYGQTFGKAQNQQNAKDLHKKLATLDLQISLTQNLFSTIKSVRNRTQKTKSQLEQMSEHESLDSITSKQQKIIDLQNDSMDEGEFERDNVAPTFSRPSQEHVHREERYENFSFKPQEPMIKVTKVSKNQPPESNLHQREGNDGDKTPAWGSF